jgi:hypothetical protein
MAAISVLTIVAEPCDVCIKDLCFCDSALKYLLRAILLKIMGCFYGYFSPHARLLKALRLEGDTLTLKPIAQCLALNFISILLDCFARLSVEHITDLGSREIIGIGRSDADMT